MEVKHKEAHLLFKQNNPFKMSKLISILLFISLFIAYPNFAQDTSAVDEIFLVVEESPQFPGGMEALYQYIGENIQYPKKAREMGIEGRVMLEFIVDKDGSIDDIKVLQGIGAGCDEEAVRVMQQSPPWIPGKQRGRAVKVRMVIPINYQFTPEEEEEETEIEVEIYAEPSEEETEEGVATDIPLEGSEESYGEVIDYDENSKYPLVVLNGQILGNSEKNMRRIRLISVEWISTSKYIKSSEAMEFYGDMGKNGALEVYTKE